MANHQFKRIRKLEAAKALFTGSFDRDPATMSDAQLISVIESADQEILTRFPDWGSMTLDAKIDALTTEAGDEVRI
jgi:hypothetical protein